MALTEQEYRDQQVALEQRRKQLEQQMQNFNNTTQLRYGMNPKGQEADRLKRDRAAIQSQIDGLGNLDNTAISNTSMMDSTSSNAINDGANPLLTELMKRRKLYTSVTQMNQQQGNMNEMGGFL